MAALAPANSSDWQLEPTFSFQLKKNLWLAVLRDSYASQSRTTLSGTSAQVAAHVLWLHEMACRSVQSHVLPCYHCRQREEPLVQCSCRRSSLKSVGTTDQRGDRLEQNEKELRPCYQQEGVTRVMGNLLFMESSQYVPLFPWTYGNQRGGASLRKLIVGQGACRKVRENVFPFYSQVSWSPPP